MVSTHVSADISAGAVVNLRPGSFYPGREQIRRGQCEDRSGDAGDLTASAPFWKWWKPKWATWTSPSRTCWFPWAGASKTKRTSRSPRNWPMPWARWFPARVPSWTPSGWRNPVRWAPAARRSNPKSIWPAASAGSFQHMGGIKGAPFIVAINKNVKAPIFQVADVGIEADILDFLPELTEAINEL
jgi:electron transfer flavoprotein alpha subunit